MSAPEISILLPARHEGDALWETVRAIHDELGRHAIAHEFVVVNDADVNGDPASAASAAKLGAEGVLIQYVERRPPAKGFGTAVREGLARFKGSACIIAMADGSEDPADFVRFTEQFREGYDCVFGSRFVAGGRVTGYDYRKLFWNRVANRFLSVLFGIPYDDFTNASKLYSRAALERIGPLRSEHFDITIELPLRAYLAGLRVAVVPNSWTAKGTRASHFRLGSVARLYLRTALRLRFGGAR